MHTALPRIVDILQKGGVLETVEGRGAGYGFTWRHVEGGSTAEVRGVGIGCCQSKVCELDGTALIGHQNVLWLEVSVVDAHRMAVLDCIQYLQEGMLGEQVVPDKVATLSDVAEEVAFWTKLDHHKGTV